MTRNLVVALLTGAVIGAAIATNEWRFIWAAICGEAVFLSVWLGLAFVSKETGII